MSPRGNFIRSRGGGRDDGCMPYPAGSAFIDSPEYGRGDFLSVGGERRVRGIMGILTRRIYKPAVPADGCRVLVERLWPRGTSRERAHVDLRVKDAGASTKLRKRFGHDPMKCDEFRLRYFDEIRGRPDIVDTLRNVTRDHAVVSLLFSASDEERNNAVALKEYLEYSA